MARLIFSQRYARALRANKLKVDLPEHVRRRLWATIVDQNHSCYVRRDPNDEWTDTTDVVSETALALRTDHAWERLPGNAAVGAFEANHELRGLVLDGPARNVLDAVETYWSLLDEERRDGFKTKVNQILELEDCPWRLFEGKFFKLDPAFVGAGATQIALENLAGGAFAGAMDEYAKACREQASEETKDAIADACKSYESVLKVLTGLGHANADPLTKKLLADGYLDDRPQDIREGFRSVVLMSLPFVRNKLAGHGQGAQVIDVPQAYGALASQLAAAFHNFLIAKHLERNPPKAAKPAPPSWDDELPF